MLTDMAVKYFHQEDHELIDELVTYNPFQRGHTWEGLKQQLQNEMCRRRTAKSLRDRALVLLQQRLEVVRQQEKA